MAPLNIPANYYEAVFHHSITGSTRPALCTIGFHYTGANFDGDATTVSDDWDTTVMSMLSDQITHVETTWADASGVIRSYPSTQVGGQSDPMSPPNVAYLVKKTTNLGGRKNRGRLYLPGVDELHVDAVGTIDATRRTAIQNAINTWVADCIASDMQPTILHHSITAPTDVATFVVQPVVATQRRRLRK
jgi:hypothetical protein